MQLQPGEMTILAYFSTATSAENAAEELRKQGYDIIQTDQISRLPNRKTNNRKNTSISSMVLDSSFYNRSLGPLLAADPSVSGMGVSYEQSGNTAFILTLVTNQGNVQQAVQILKNHGAII